MKRSKAIFGSKMEVFLGIALMLGLLLPHTNNMLLLVNPILCVIFLLIKRLSFYRIGLVPIIAIILSFIINAAGNATEKSLLMMTTIFLCIFTFPMISNVKLRNIYIYLCFGAIFLSQVAYMFNLDFFISFIDTYYPISWGEDFITRTNENVSISNYLEYRQGGIYRNPNQLAKYVLFLLAIYLANNNKSSFRQQAFFVALCYCSVILTGSRTGLVILGFLVLLAILRYQRFSRSARIFIALLLLSLFVFSILFGFGGRAALVEQGLRDSAGAKFALFLDYLSHEHSIKYLLLGHLDYSLFKGSYVTTYSLDCEYGYVIYCFGFIGFLAFIYYIYSIYKRVEKTNRIFFVLLLFMLSSTILMSYRAIFVFMLLLSTLFNIDRVQTSNPSSDNKSRIIKGGLNDNSRF